MKSLLIIRNVKVENANAIAGLTYGFPPVSAFLGFTHALSRALQGAHQLTLGGCAVICHQHQVHAHQPGGWGDFVFSLTRNPLTREGNTPAFVEEGRMNMEVSLLIECNFISDDINFSAGNSDESIRSLEQWILTQALTQRLAGGTITDAKRAEFLELDDDRDERRKQVRKVLYRSLPGTALIDRSELLEEHFQHQLRDNPDSEMLDTWLDFVALKRQAVPELKDDEQPTEDHKAEWEYLPKPAGGWLVPIAVGYKAISPLYDNAEVARTRDTETPFRFVETAYGLGQWIAPHRIRHIEDLIWRYHVDGDWYLCKNSRPTTPNYV